MIFVKLILVIVTDITINQPDGFVNTYFKVLDNFFHRTERAPESGVGRRLGAR